MGPGGKRNDRVESLFVHRMVVIEATTTEKRTMDSIVARPERVRDKRAAGLICIYVYQCTLVSCWEPLLRIAIEAEFGVWAEIHRNVRLLVMRFTVA